MRILSTILGIILVAFGFICIFSPVSAVLATGYLLCIFLLVFGVIGLIRTYITKIIRPFKLIVCILAIIFGIICLVRPGASLVFDGIVIYLIAIWFFVYGVFAVIDAIRYRKDVKGWGWGLFVGILGIIVGILAIAYPMAAVLAAGIMIGLFFIDAGLGMLTIGTFADEFGARFKKAMFDAEKEAAEEVKEDAAEAAADVKEAAEEVKEDAADAAADAKDAAADAADDIKPE